MLISGGGLGPLNPYDDVTGMKNNDVSDLLQGPNFKHFI